MIKIHSPGRVRLKGVDLSDLLNNDAITIVDKVCMLLHDGVLPDSIFNNLSAMWEWFLPPEYTPPSCVSPSRRASSALQQIIDVVTSYAKSPDDADTRYHQIHTMALLCIRHLIETQWK